jgi:hypothetical protein
MMLRDVFSIGSEELDGYSNSLVDTCKITINTDSRHSNVMTVLTELLDHYLSQSGIMDAM